MSTTPAGWTHRALLAPKGRRLAPAALLGCGALGLVAHRFLGVGFP